MSANPVQTSTAQVCGRYGEGGTTQLGARIPSGKSALTQSNKDEIESATRRRVSSILRYDSWKSEDPEALRCLTEERSTMTNARRGQSWIESIRWPWSGTIIVQVQIIQHAETSYYKRRYSRGRSLTASRLAAGGISWTGNMRHDSHDNWGI